MDHFENTLSFVSAIGNSVTAVVEETYYVYDELTDNELHSTMETLLSTNKISRQNEKEWFPTITADFPGETAGKYYVIFVDSYGDKRFACVSTKECWIT